MAEAVYHPTDEAAESAWINRKDYAQLYQQSLDDPDGGIRTFIGVNTNFWNNEFSFSPAQCFGRHRLRPFYPGARNGTPDQSASKLNISRMHV